MDELKRLVELIAQRGSKSSPLINQQDDNSLETKLFNLVKKGEVQNDEDAASLLYGERKLSANYRMLKSRVRKKLFNQLYFLEFPEDKFSLSNVESCKIESILLEARILVTANEYKLANKLLDQALTMAKSHQICMKAVRALEIKQVINTIIGSKRTYWETAEELYKYYEIEASERTALRLFQSTTLELKASVNDRSLYLSKVPGVLQELFELWEKSNSSRIYSIYHILNILYLEMCGQYAYIAKAVEKAEYILEQGILHPTWFDNKYNAFIRIYALLRIRQYEEGLSLAAEYLQLFEPQTVNWFAFMENYLLLALHAQRYALAGELLQKTLDNDFFPEIQQPARERWELYRRYLILMSDVLPGRLRIELPRDVFAELVTLPKDKAGFNLSLLVLDVIRSFTIKSIDDYEPQAERIRKYIMKYMRGEKAERPRLFLRLLQLAIRNELDFARTREAGSNLSAKLSQADPPGDAFAEVEVVPYENLWEAVLMILKRRGLPQ